eukprot:CAMPEP_0116019498 /NCGR_PEP_ID=MMETSP0321-20121206/9272_1 /TAXON_ID=163516 /ORGANISM="Leptocylindrus danicus var. danicus, Strain B650" /LENGTH=156 /DNA_ID=CAMNT_0003490079 /DNA_START=84 /DNA_END=554 /DNA_ORIENTATION=-
MECSSQDVTRTPAPASAAAVKAPPAILRANKKRNKRQLNDVDAPHLQSTSLMIPNLNESHGRALRYSYDVTLTLRMSDSFSKSRQWNSNSWERSLLSRSEISQHSIDENNENGSSDEHDNDGQWFTNDSAVPILSNDSKLIWSGRSSAFRPFCAPR